MKASTTISASLRYSFCQVRGLPVGQGCYSIAPTRLGRDASMTRAPTSGRCVVCRNTHKAQDDNVTEAHKSVLEFHLGPEIARLTVFVSLQHLVVQRSHCECQLNRGQSERCTRMHYQNRRILNRRFYGAQWTFRAALSLDCDADGGLGAETMAMLATQLL